jgi:hypothetical protein
MITRNRLTPACDSHIACLSPNIDLLPVRTRNTLWVASLTRED